MQVLIDEIYKSRVLVNNSLSEHELLMDKHGFEYFTDSGMKINEMLFKPVQNLIDANAIPLHLALNIQL